MTKPKERGILFNGDMVRALLDGRKTQLRRIVKPQPPTYIDDLHGGELSKRAPYTLEDYETGCIVGSGFEDDDGRFYKSPYGNVGDLLFCRETFCIETSYNIDVDYEPPFSDGRPIRWQESDSMGRWWEQCHYRATDPCPELCTLDDEPVQKWRPSIHMPKWAARIWREITGVRVERLQDITEEDAVAEGVQSIAWFPERYKLYGQAANSIVPWSLSAKESFRTLWQSINGPGSWFANDLVWVYEFKPVERPA